MWLGFSREMNINLLLGTVMASTFELGLSLCCHIRAARNRYKEASGSVRRLLREQYTYPSYKKHPKTLPITHLTFP